MTDTIHEGNPFYSEGRVPRAYSHSLSERRSAPPSESADSRKDLV